MKRYLLLPITLMELTLNLAGAEGLITMTPEQQKAFGITVAAPQPSKQSYTAKLPAKVAVPNAQLQVVSARQGGLVEILLVAVGDKVKQGQPLARIQSPELVELQRDFLQAQSRLNLAKANYDRDRQLAQEGVIAQRRLHKTKVAYQEVETTLAQQREALRLAGVGPEALRVLETQKKLSSVLTVLAPIDGEVLEQMAVAGQRVDAASPLYRIGKLQPLWIEIHVPLEKAERAQIGNKVLIPEYQVEGKVTTIGRDVHEADQGVLIRAEVHEGAERLRPGQFIQVQLGVDGNGQTRYRVPRGALIRHQQQALVFVRTPEGFQPYPVQVVSEDGDAVVIKAELPKDAQLATSGGAALKAALTSSEEEG